jgi:hypothetical protein
VEAQGADLRRFDKHKKEGNFRDGWVSPSDELHPFCGTQGIKVWMGNHPLPSCAVHKRSCRIVVPDLVWSDCVLKIYFLWIRNMFGKVKLFMSPWCGCSVPQQKRKTQYCLPIIRKDVGNLLSNV